MGIYKIHITSEISLEKLQQGLFIFIFRASRIPPHIGVIANGKLFDITSIGPNIDLNVDDFYCTVLKRKTEVVFIELQPVVNSDVIISEKVKYYWKVTSTTSCLNPIKDFLNEIYQIDVAKARFIFELLPMLHEKNLIQNISEINLSNKLCNNRYDLVKYTEKDIEDCIKALHRKEKIDC